LAKGWRQSAFGGVHLERGDYVGIVRPAIDGPGFRTLMAQLGVSLVLEGALADGLEMLATLERAGS